MSPLSDRAQTAAHRAREMTMAKRNGARSTTETWLETLGSKFVDVQLYIKGEWAEERHIDDPETLETTVLMSLERLAGGTAIIARPGGWQIISRPPHPMGAKLYPTREAAEMVAIHRG